MMEKDNYRICDDITSQEDLRGMFESIDKPTIDKDALLAQCRNVFEQTKSAIACPAGTRANFLILEASTEIDKLIAALKAAGVGNE